MPHRLMGNLIAFSSMLLWSTSFPVTEVLLATWHPFLLIAARLGIAGMTFLTVMVVTGNVMHLRAVPWRDIVVIGGLGIGVSTTLLVWGQDYSNPVTVAVIATTVPLVSAIMGVIKGEERVTVMIAIGIACAIAGGVMASLPPEGASLHFRGGEILVVGSVVGFAWFSRATVTRLSHLPDTAKTALLMSFATIVVVIVGSLSTAVGGLELYRDYSWQSLGWLLWLGCISNGLSMLLWLTASRKLGVTIAAIHLNGVPFYVILIALAFGGTLYATQVWGACLVAAGALFAQLPAAAERAARVPVRSDD